MADPSLEQLEALVEERAFAETLRDSARPFFVLSNALLGSQRGAWNKRHYFQLINETDNLETFLDDYGARFNRTFAFLTELVASLRWFAYAGYSLTHLVSRLDSYGSAQWNLPGDPEKEIRAHLDAVREVGVSLLSSFRAETDALGISWPAEALPESNFQAATARLRLPRNVGQAELLDEEQKIAEVATKYLQACEMMRGVGVRRLEDGEERHEVFKKVASEAQARVYEATVHNLQSTYDTHIQNTVLEAEDSRLGHLRGHVSGALHLLEALTYMAHFIERHEADIRSEEAKRKIAELVDRPAIEDLAWNGFLFWAHAFLEAGIPLAEDLLPEYTNFLELEVEIPDHLSLHARPAALVVAIVNHYGTPVEMEVGGKRCNAGSILELLVTVGSQSDPKSFLFRGDERPVRDIGELFRHQLGEDGLETLPGHLSYLLSR